ncbi:hypothetical protein [Nocardia sp. NBC_00416]|uniref:hypothetical protein n=1 Tax=Nocardia sp. NBC_00416 TaxID=2975991 RepID=UPI002E24F84F
MAQVVPLNWVGSFCNFGGPLASGETDYWWAAGGDWGRDNRAYLFTAFCDGSVAAEIVVRNIGHYRSGHDETRFEIHNSGSSQPVYYYFYIAWSSPIEI